MAYYNGQVVGFYYNGKAFDPQVTISSTPSIGIIDGQLVTADGLYFMTADNEEFIAKESANG